MSQAKVDAHKEEKKNRQATVKKERRNRLLARVIVTIVLVAIAFWIVFTIVRYYQRHREITPITVNTSAISDYMSDL